MALKGRPREPRVTETGTKGVGQHLTGRGTACTLTRDKFPLHPGDLAHTESIPARVRQIEPSEVRHRLWENLAALLRRLPIKPVRNDLPRSERIRRLLRADRWPLPK